MEIEQLEIRDYLTQVTPLDQLNSKRLTQLINFLEITYVRKGKEILKHGEINEQLYLIRSGAVEVCDKNKTLFGRYSDGQWLGHRSLMHQGKITLDVYAIEDCLLYILPKQVFFSLLDESEYIKQFFNQYKPERIKYAITELRNTENSTLIASQVGDLIHGTCRLIEKSLSIQATAQLMKTNIVTAVMVVDQGKLCGIITDRAFCTKVVAEDADIQQPIASIMTPKPITVTADMQASEALLIMARYNVRHLPVMQSGQPIGMITATDLIRRQSHNAIYLINEIHRADHVNELQTLSLQVSNTLYSLVENSLTAYDIGHAISAIGRAITVRLIKMAEAQFGTAPIAYTWVAAGSLARNDQTAHSDQDNALILSDEYDPNIHQAYFEQLANFVCDNLDRCGYVYCPGEVMASNPKWRQPLSIWTGYFEEWILRPKPKSLMYASIFFDLHSLYGDESLLQNLMKGVLEKTKGNSIFLAHMAANALHYQPPLGFFRNLVLEKSGEHAQTLNMKKRGVVPITDLARVYALSAGLAEINTQDRLQAAYKARILSQEGMMDLLDAYEFIGFLRLQHQANQVTRGETLDNYIHPSHLSSLERRHLKDAFEVVSTLQSSLAHSHHLGIMG